MCLCSYITPPCSVLHRNGGVGCDVFTFDGARTEPCMWNAEKNACKIRDRPSGSLVTSKEDDDSEREVPEVENFDKQGQLWLHRTAHSNG
uniref:Uncharacterized protein n=1 Tax=Anguilla anguilla TaxID=7936 RepID=A0A0E9WX32_ANGAN